MNIASTEMKTALDQYFDAICNDYAKWKRSGTAGCDGEQEEMIEQFKERVSYSVGQKYIRVSICRAGQESAHSFVVNTHDDSKFPYGTILKPAAWESPSRNKARGNVFEDVSHIQWTYAH